MAKVAIQSLAIRHALFTGDHSAPQKHDSPDPKYITKRALSRWRSASNAQKFTHCWAYTKLKLTKLRAMAVGH